MEPPATTDGQAARERRLSSKIERSPGSFFKARSRELVLAADYFRERLQPGAYSATARQHYHTLCGATFAMLLSSFELTWKLLYARIIDATSMYDSRVVDDKELKISTEAALAHRESAGAGILLAEAVGVWQRPGVVNGRFGAAFQVEPIDPMHHDALRDLWQVRHVIAHGSGVTSELDSYRLRRAILPHRALQLDGDYLRRAETELLAVVSDGVSRVGTRLLDDYFNRNPAPIWTLDQQEFTRLFLLGLVAAQTQDLPDVDEPMFLAERAKRP